MTTPADIVNRALDAAGSDIAIGDLEEGTRPAEVALRQYGPVLKQLLRAAHWDFARQQSPLTLLADASGQTANVGTQVPVPWLYEYALPVDCLQPRFVPLNTQATGLNTPTGNIGLPATPPTTVANLTPPALGRVIPARFTIATDYNYPVVPQPSSAYVLGTGLTITGATQANPCVLTVANSLSAGALVYISGVGGMTQLNGNTYAVSAATSTTLTLEDASGNAIDATGFGAYTSGGTAQPVSPTIPTAQPWGQGVQWWEVQGTSPASRTVILTNVAQANLVYTAYLPYPTLWDSLFEEAFVAALAERIALPLNKDKKLGMALRQQNMAIARQALQTARLRDGNEGWPTTDHCPDWVAYRNSGSRWANWGGPWPAADGPGSLGLGWSAYGFGDGSAY